MDATPSSDESPVVLQMAPVRQRATWLTVLGVCAIIFGALGLLTGCFHAEFPFLVAVTPYIKWASSAAATAAVPTTAPAVASGAAGATGATGAAAATWSQSSGFNYRYNVTVGPATGPASGITGGAGFGPGPPPLTGPMPKWAMTVPAILLGVAAVVHWGLALYLLILGIGALAEWRSIGRQFKIYAWTKLVAVACSIIVLMMTDLSMGVPGMPSVFMSASMAMWVGAGALCPIAVLIVVHLPDHADYLRRRRAGQL